MLEKQHTKFASEAQPDSAIEQLLSLFGGIQQREKNQIWCSRKAHCKRISTITAGIAASRSATVTVHSLHCLHKAQAFPEQQHTNCFD